MRWNSREVRTGRRDCGGCEFDVDSEVVEVRGRAWADAREREGCNWLTTARRREAEVRPTG